MILICEQTRAPGQLGIALSGPQRSVDLLTTSSGGQQPLEGKGRLHKTRSIEKPKSRATSLGGSPASIKFYEGFCAYALGRVEFTLPNRAFTLDFSVVYWGEGETVVWRSRLVQPEFNEDLGEFA